ncbi:hypothetical protein Aave_2906 [Paracidovorax citrulli AAC00-1]|uniref:Uncharacterized protein n=1 Tax=Paracidovorax citrulli (strain AAC00-1) TaxID=397945 RepID=A1TR86_PARC0|nr:hypothetical protein Aave_2906 [Paracidovorax citrulli AAC00-1]
MLRPKLRGGLANQFGDVLGDTRGLRDAVDDVRDHGAGDPQLIRYGGRRRVTHADLRLDLLWMHVCYPLNSTCLAAVRNLLCRVNYVNSTSQSQRGFCESKFVFWGALA